MDDKENLFKEFPEITEAEWIEKVEKDLKGKSFEDLFWKLNEDIEIAPFYYSNDLNPSVPNNKSTSNIWEIGEDIFVNDPKLANKQLLIALENGINAPRLVLNSSLDEVQMATIFENIELNFISIHFFIKKPDSSSLTLAAFFNYLLKSNIDSTKIHGSINHNENQILELAKFVIEKLPNFKINTLEVEAADPRNISKSLAQAISKGNEYLALLNKNGVDPKTTNDHLQFSVSVGTSYFAEIAKISALKILWENVMEAYAVKNVRIPDVEAHLSKNTFGNDPNTNIIRATTQAMSAVLGGVNRLTVLPSNANISEVNDFSKRIARNVQHILMMESFFDRVIDTSKGSYYIEKLTEKIAETAWIEFQKLEEKRIAVK